LYEAEGEPSLPSCTDRQNERKEKQHAVNVREGVKVYCHSILNYAIEELTCHTVTLEKTGTLSINKLSLSEYMKNYS